MPDVWKTGGMDVKKEVEEEAIEIKKRDELSCVLVSFSISTQLIGLN